MTLCSIERACEICMKLYHAAGICINSLCNLLLLL